MNNIAKNNQGITEKNNLRYLNPNNSYTLQHRGKILQ